MREWSKRSARGRLLKAFATGLETWIAHGALRVRRARIGLISHAAAVGVDGISALDRLVAAGLKPRLVFTPEHGYWGGGGAGETIHDDRHPLYGVPLRSLYGARRVPTPDDWRALDLLLVDLQDLGARCYTYVSTLRDVLESAALAGKPVLVADRPSPLAAIVDGPLLDPSLESFVAHVPAPFVYGMTIGETARWLQATFQLDLDLTVMPMRGYIADGRRPPNMPWIPPSPGIRAWESAWGYPVGVFSEAMALLRTDRGGPLSFQVLAVPESVSKAWKPAASDFPSLGKKRRSSFQGLESAVWQVLRRLELPGARLEFHRYRSGTEWCVGARIVVRDPAAWRPASAAVQMFVEFQKLFGGCLLWEMPGTRPEFFDRLWGDAAVRRDLCAGRSARVIIRSWDTSRRYDFAAARERAWLYGRGTMAGRQ